MAATDIWSRTACSHSLSSSYSSRSLFSTDVQGLSRASSRPSVRRSSGGHWEVSSDRDLSPACRSRPQPRASTNAAQRWYLQPANSPHSPSSQVSRPMDPATLDLQRFSASRGNRSLASAPATEYPGQQGTGEAQLFPSAVSSMAQQPPSQLGQVARQQNALPVGQMPPSSARISKTKTSANSSQKTSDEMGQWFAEMICHIWFAPDLSNMSGWSMPVSPSKGLEDVFVPARQSIGHYKTRSQDFSFSTLSAPPERPLGPSTSTENIPRVHSDDQRLIPQRRFVSFIRDVVRVSSVSVSVLMLALLYVHRLKRMHPTIEGKDGSEFRVAIAALMLGNKFLDDHTYTNKSWSDISGIALKDVNKLEVEFWLGLQMTIHVTMRDFGAWKATLHTLNGQRRQMLSKRIADVLRRQAVPLEQSSPQSLRFRNSISGGHAAHGLASGTTPVDGGSFAWELTRALQGTKPAAAASTPGSFDLGDVNSNSPTSQRSISTTATSAAGAFNDAKRSSPEGAFHNSRHASPFDVAGPVHKHMTIARNPSCALPGRSAAEMACLGSTIDPGRKRRRDDSPDDWHAARVPKRVPGNALQQDIGSDQVRPAALLPTSSGRYSLDRHASTVPQGLPYHSIGAPHMVSTANNAAMHTANSINAESESLFRSMFAQPLTPDGLAQPYAGPAPATSTQRQLSFYQLASGQSHGLPAYHLAAPVQQNPWVDGSSHARRTFLQNLSPQSVSSCPPHYPVTLQPAPSAQSARVSPQTSGMECWDPYAANAGRQFNVGPSAASCSGSPLDYSSFWSSSRPPAAAQDTGVQGTQRWVPFCNVPIAMQLQHFQQWQQLGAHTVDERANFAGYQQGPLPSNRSDGYRGTGAWPTYYSPDRAP